MSDVALLALEKAHAAGADPALLRFLVASAEDLPSLLSPGSVARIFLNFSDPWPKKGHAKRRLTHRRFLALYEGLLAPGGRLFCKTDSRDFYFFTREELSACGYRVERESEDLHASSLAGGNIETEYERAFRAAGKPIYYLEATPPSPPARK